MAVRVRSTKVVRGHGADTAATTEWSAAAGLPTRANYYKLVEWRDHYPVATTNYDNSVRSSFQWSAQENPKLTGGSITEIVEAKTTVTQVCIITLTSSAPLG